MKKLFTLFSALLFVASAHAQFAFDFVFEKHHLFGDQSNAELVAQGYVKNTSGSAQVFDWELTSSQWNNNWGVYVVDADKQHDTTVTSASFNLANGDSALLEIHIVPRMIVFAGELTITLNMQSDPFDLLEDKVKISVHTLGVRKDLGLPKKKFEVYPNPASKQLSLDLETEKSIDLQIFNSLG